jgi:nucleosome assembly protein 1-like 1
MMQAKLGSLVGRSSGYIESLPVSVRRRVAGLKGIQKDHAKLEAEFQEEVLQLEKKYFAKFTPLYQDRAKIVNGVIELRNQNVDLVEIQGTVEEVTRDKCRRAAEEVRYTIISLHLYFDSHFKSPCLRTEGDVHSNMN